MRSECRKGEEGIALLLALLFVVLLTALVVEYLYETQVEATFTVGSSKAFEASIAAKSAIATAKSLLVADLLQLDLPTTGVAQDATGMPYDGLDEAWAFGVPFQEFNEAVMQCSIDDEYGKLNLNALTHPDTQQQNVALIETLRVLFEMRGVEEDPVDAILDWMDTDDEPRPAGGETDYYQALEVPYSAKNGPMAAVEELLLIPGITPAVYFGDPELDQLPLSELLTVHGDRRGRINLNTAEFELLDAFGLAVGQTGLGEAVLSERERMPFYTVEDYTTRGILPAQLSNPAMTTATNAQGDTVNLQLPVTVSSQVFRLRGHGIAGWTKVRIETFVRRDEQSTDGLFKVLDWRMSQ